MNKILIEIASHALAAIAVTVFVPYLVFVLIKEAYQEDQDNSCMHRSIEAYLREQRGYEQQAKI